MPVNADGNHSEAIDDGVVGAGGATATAVESQPRPCGVLKKGEKKTRPCGAAQQAECLSLPSRAGRFFDGERMRHAPAEALVPFDPIAGRLTRDEDGRVEIGYNGEGGALR